MDSITSIFSIGMTAFSSIKASIAASSLTVASLMDSITSIVSITSRSLVYHSLYPSTTTRHTGRGAGAKYGLHTAGSGVTSAMILATILATDSHSTGLADAREVP